MIVTLIGLNACAAPLITSLIGNGSTLIATGKIEQVLFKQSIDTLLHKETGKTLQGHVRDIVLNEPATGLSISPS